ncbi:mannose-6-phosphate isomerase, class I [Neolewinella sp.]|uniref:mannose-6-phosphate isomerase, class I n=1 Tax=Neolewinella sp. TaxID=2993543 RepID=UPI003B52CD8C
MPTFYPFDGVIQHYAWGGYTYLPQLLDQSNPQHQPWAEFWMGAHPKGPGQLRGSEHTLDELIARQPETLLGAEVARRFDDDLPFLFKILDVREMLSIQVHPTKEAAEKGFAREEREGPARDAPDRNYRDDNHKPELGVALTDFYLLHGFRSESEIRETLSTTPGWNALLDTFDTGGTKALYARVMRAGQPEIDRLLQPLVDRLAGGTYTRDAPAFWAQRAVEQYTQDGHHDRGMFSIYWFNLVHLQPGEGIFQDAGIPHAYLEGCCIELMANSDNVLRGGLTPKHIDVPELLDNTRFDPVQPSILHPQAASPGWQTYATPAPDFKLLRSTPMAGTSLTVDTQSGASILLLLDGQLSGDGVALATDARTTFVAAGNELTLSAAEDSVVFLATVGA